MDTLGEKKEKAYNDWKSGMKQKEISEKYEVKLNTVKSWAIRDWKKREEKVATKPQKVATSKKPRGAPKGNRNAVGNQGGAPPRNKNNLKHGAFSQIYWDTLDDDELEMLNHLSYDEETDLENQIALLTIRERRLMGNIKKFKDIQNQQGLYDPQGELESTVREAEDLKTSKISTFEALLKLETILTNIQAKKTKCLETLHKIRQDRLDREEKAKTKEQVEKMEEESVELSTLSIEELKKIESILKDDE